MPCVASRRLSIATARCTWTGPAAGSTAGRGRTRAAAATAAGPACARSAGARARGAGGARTAAAAPGGRLAGSSRRPGSVSPFRPSVRRIRCTSTPITPEPSPWRPERRDREPRHVAHLAVGALADRVRDALAQRVELHALLPPYASASEMPALDRLALDRAEEEALEDLVEEDWSSWTWRSSPRGGSEVLLGRPRHGLQRGERVEDLGRPDRPCPPCAARRRSRACARRSPRASLRKVRRGLTALSRLVAREDATAQLHARRARPPRRDRCGA
jgi:hypothetical protein